MPTSWPFEKRKAVFITNPAPGPHAKANSIPLRLILRDMLHLTVTSNEAKKGLMQNTIMVDGIIRRDSRFPVGLFDSLVFKETSQSWRMLLNRDGKLHLYPVSAEEAGLKVAKITGKTLLKKGKVQLNLYDGKNLVVDKDSFKVGDSLLISVPELKIKDHLPLAVGSAIMLASGKHRGEAGTVVDIMKERAIVKNAKGEVVETLTRYLFVVGKQKPAIKFPEE
ncbi:30S ribosomal protein S4e [Candidatus Woesearchaeota archaeon]|nr:30S ribosomal protein S4e [Candidatus Woesearchaeota archaeon]